MSKGGRERAIERVSERVSSRVHVCECGEELETCNVRVHTSELLKRVNARLIACARVSGRTHTQAPDLTICFVAMQQRKSGDWRPS